MAYLRWSTRLDPLTGEVVDQDEGSVVSRYHVYWPGPADKPSREDQQLVIMVCEENGESVRAGEQQVSMTYNEVVDELLREWEDNDDKGWEREGDEGQRLAVLNALECWIRHMDREFEDEEGDDFFQRSARETLSTALHEAFHELQRTALTEQGTAWLQGKYEKIPSNACTRAVNVLHGVAHTLHEIACEDIRWIWTTEMGAPRDITWYLGREDPQTHADAVGIVLSRLIWTKGNVYRVVGEATRPEQVTISIRSRSACREGDLQITVTGTDAAMGAGPQWMPEDTMMAMTKCCSLGREPR